MIGHLTHKGVHKAKYKYKNPTSSTFHWTYIVRHPRKKKRELIARGMEECLNKRKYIKYSNGKKSVDLYDKLKPKFNISKLSKKTWANCCNIVSVCCRYAGLKTPRKCDSRTVPKEFEKIGFKVIKYSKDKKLYRGDILVSTTMPHCHTVIYLGRSKDAK